MDYVGIPKGEHIEHYGVKGMKWGKHKAKRQPAQRISEDEALYRQMSNLEKQRPGNSADSKILAGSLDKSYRRMYDSNHLSREGLKFNKNSTNMIRRAADKVIKNSRLSKMATASADAKQLNQAKRQGAATNASRKKARSVSRTGQLMRGGGTSGMRSNTNNELNQLRKSKVGGKKKRKTTSRSRQLMR